LFIVRCIPQTKYWDPLNRHELVQAPLTTDEAGASLTSNAGLRRAKQL